MARIDNLENMMRQVTKAAQKPIRPDAASMAVMREESAIQANTAREFDRISQDFEVQMQEIAEQNERRDAAIQRTAQENIEHTRLLEKQLQEKQTQNELLRTEIAAYRTEHENSEKTNKRNRIIGYITTGASILIAIASLFVAICK